MPESFGADAAIVTEPGHLEVTLSHKGFAWFDVEVQGRAAHGSRPEPGIDAITRAGHFLVALDEPGKRLARGPAHPLLGTGTVLASVIRGGEEPSTHPAHCRITVERRTVPGEDADSVGREPTAVLDGLAATVTDFRYRLTRGLHRAPFEADPEAAIVRTLTRHAERALGRRCGLPAGIRRMRGGPRPELYVVDSMLLPAHVPAPLGPSSASGSPSARADPRLGRPPLHGARPRRAPPPPKGSP